MPLSLGASIIYLDEVTGEQLSHGLQAGQVTAMVGVPALWQLLERRIKGQIQDQGSLFEAIIDAMLELNRRLGKNAKLDVGSFALCTHSRSFGRQHQVLNIGWCSAASGYTEVLLRTGTAPD